MSDRELHSHYTDLISRYLSGNASPEEIQELETWVLADPENKARFIELKKTWMLAGIKNDQVGVDVEQIWEETSGQLFREGRVVEMTLEKRMGGWRRMAVAAAVALLAAFTLWYFLKPETGKIQYVQTAGEAQSFDLSDGTAITLNQASSLKFNPETKDKRRFVELEGDAYFDVARDEQRPFIITTQKVEIEVLGTSFYVDSREDEGEVQVMVESGRVAVRYEGKEVILTAGEKGVWNKAANTLSEQENDDENFLAIKTGKLNFEDTPMEEVVFVLNRYYHVNISFGNQSLKECEFTSPFDNKPLSTVFRVMEEAYNITVSQEGEGYILTGECDKN